MQSARNGHAARVKRRYPRQLLAMGVLGVLVVALALAAVLGPRVDVSVGGGDMDLGVPAIADLDTYLANAEAAVPDLTPGAEKTIRWAGGPGQRTAVALVYLHGFSSSRQESAPLMDQVASALGANLYYARLRGHGRTGEALAAASVADWQRDAWEALAIGRQLGEQVVLVGASNGGTLATWLATRPGAADLAALILLSPNFGPRDPMSEILLWPWAHVLVRWVVGPEYQWTPQNPEHARYWTWRYPSEALLAMMGVVKLARISAVERIQAPVLVLYAPDDQVVSAAKIERFFPRFGAADTRLLPLENTSDRQHHALAGDILAPADTARVRELILAFLQPRLADG